MKCYLRYIQFVLIGISILVSHSVRSGQQWGMSQISGMIRSIPGLDEREISSLILAFDMEMGGQIFNTQVDAHDIEVMKGIVSAGIFEEVDSKPS